MVNEAQNGATANGVCEKIITPEWLNKSFFKDVLDQEFGKHEIRSFVVSNAIAKGENYASLMNRVKMDLELNDGTTKTVSYIVKSMLQNEASNNLMTQMAIFPKEIEMYEKILPAMNNLYREMGLDLSVGPKCVKTLVDPPVIVLEDLTVEGYENIKRHEGMDLDHVHVTLEKLAKFHAATARLYELNGPFSEKFSKGLFNPEMLEMMKQMMEGFWIIMEDCIRKWGDCEQYIEKLKNTNARFVELLTECDKIDPNGFNVLSHGDMWCNNIMFKHAKDGAIEDVKFVDLQMCKWGSPALDLQYFLITSCNYDIRLSKFDYFIKYYHDQLVKNLKQINYAGKVPTLVELHIDILKRGFFGLNVSFGTLTAVLVEPNENADMESFLQESDAAINFKRQLFTTPRYVKAMKSLLPWFDNRGVLDF